MSSPLRIAALCAVVTAPLGCRASQHSGANGADTTYHGVAVSDPYRWLEDGSAPHVKAWIDSQNVRTDSVINTFAQGPALAKRIAQLATTSPARFGPTIAGTSLYYFREVPPQPQPVLMRSALPSGAEHVVVDVNSLPGGANIVAYWPSPSGRYLAYGTALGGSELATIHFIDSQTGKPLADTLPYAGGGTTPVALAWDADERGVTYTRYNIPAANQPVQQFDISLYHHAFGSSTDSASFGQGYSHIAEFRLLTSDDGKEAAVLANKGDGGFADVYTRGAQGWSRVIPDSAGVTTATYAGDKLLAVATGGTPRGRVLAVSPNGQVSQVLGERPWGVQSISPISGGMLVVEDSGTKWRVEHYADNGSLVRVVGLPTENIGIGNIASSSAAGSAIIEWDGWTTPGRWQRYDARTGALTTIQEMKSAGDYSKIQTHVVDAVSKDGTHVPVTVIAMAGTPQDGTAPAILNGYGGFDIPTSPSFLGANLAWLERGGVLAVANMRGGNEFGEAWHEAGKGAHKQNVFDDFYAAAEMLVNNKWTSTDRLGIVGGSNGGLLMGAELTQHPEAFRAVVSSVGIYDMLRHETFPNGAYNVTEYGTVADSADFAALYAYSPLHHVKSGTAYPATLLETAVNDARVAPWQSRKFAEALESASSSSKPVLLLTRMNAGHGIGAPFAQRVDQASLTMTFFAHELGLKDSTVGDTKGKAVLKRP